MSFTDYQNESKKSMEQPFSTLYLALGLCGEAGEVANNVKKLFRDKNKLSDEEFERLRKDTLAECGDVLWYLSQLCSSLDGSLQGVALGNLRKLRRRYNIPHISIPDSGSEYESNSL